MKINRVYVQGNYRAEIEILLLKGSCTDSLASGSSRKAAIFIEPKPYVRKFVC